MSMIAAFLGGLAVRTARIAVEASPYILIGLAVSGLARAAAGPARLRRFFGTGSWSGPARAWAVGTMLPVCSLGVLPIVRELRRSGVRRDVVLTFALAGAMFNPVTLLAASTRMDLRLLSLLLVGSAATAVAAARFAGEGETVRPVDEALPAPGRARGAAAAVHSLREASGGAWIELGAGVAAAAIVSALVSPEVPAEGVFAGDPGAEIRMAAVAAPAYVSPEVGVALIPEMVKFRQSAGAMLGLVVLGAGLSVGHVIWAARAYGPTATARWFAVILAATLALGWGLDAIVAPVGVANPDNDHFHAVVSPLESEQAAAGVRQVGEALTRSGPAGLVAPVLLAAAAALGAALRAGRLGPRSRFEDWAGTIEETTASNSPRDVRSRWAVRVVVAGAASAAILLGAWVAFPSPTEAFREMAVIKADYHGEINAADPAAPMHHLSLWERRVDRLAIGSTIRLRPPGAGALRLTHDLAAALRGLRTATASGDRDAARSRFVALQDLYDRCRRAYGAD